MKPHFCIYLFGKSVTAPARPPIQQHHLNINTLLDASVDAQLSTFASMIMSMNLLTVGKIFYFQFSVLTKHKHSLITCLFSATLILAHFSDAICTTP
jgi:hypothetical protein